MKSRLEICVAVMFLWVLVSSFATARASEENSLADWISVLDAMERQTQVLEYDVSWTEFRSSSDADIDNPKRTGYLSTSHVVFEPFAQWIHVERTGVDHVASRTDRGERGSDAPDGFGASRLVYSFDGETAMTMTHRPRGANPGDYDPKGRGMIENEPVIGRDNFLLTDKGFDAFVSSYGGKGLSQIVRNATKSRVVEGSGSLIEVHYLETQALPGEKWEMWRKVVIDMAKGSSIVAVLGYERTKDDPKEHLWSWMEVQVGQQNGMWVPTSARLLVSASGPRNIYEYEFKNVQMNHFSPESEMDRFRITFPQGTPVLDRRTGLRYVVGVGDRELQQSLEDSVNEVMKNLPSKSEAVAGSSSSAPRERTNDEPDEKLKGSFGFRMALVVGCVACLMIIAILAVRRKRKSTQVLLLLVLVTGLMGSHPGAYAKAALPQLPVRTWAWEAPGAGDATLPIYQCGLNCTLFALKFFDRPYSMETVRDALAPDHDGISLLRIKETLQAHGLNVSARSLKSPDDLKRAYAIGGVIIFPTTLEGTGHFYVTLGRSPQEGQGACLLVDAGVSVQRVRADEMWKRIARADGIVIVARKAQSDAPQAERVELEPPELDFGRMLVSEKEPLWRELTVRNTGDSPILVSTIRSDCNCSTVGWDGGVLSAKSQKKVSVTVSPAQWGMGVKSKLVMLSLGDGSARKCLLKGEGVLPDALHGLRVAPLDMHFTIDPVTHKVIGNPARKVYIYRLGKKSPQRFEVDMNDVPNWLDVRVASQPRGSVPGIVSVKIDGSKLNAMIAQSGFTVSADEKQDPVAVRIHVAEEKWYGVTKSVVFMRRSDAQHVETVAFKSSAGAAHAIWVTGVRTSSPEITAVPLACDDGTMAVKIALAKAVDCADNGIATVHVNLQNDVGLKAVEAIKVVVSE